MHRIPALLLALFGFLIATEAAYSQGPPENGIVGRFELRDENGNPPIAGATVGIDVAPGDLPGFYRGRPWVNRGQGRQYIESEEMEIWGHPAPWGYDFILPRRPGVFGYIQWNGSNYQSRTSTGVTRIWRPTT